jgi:polysaccharide pyruvyl transferase CsaB
MRIVLGGYYGCGNIGDDALLYGLLTGLGAAPWQITVLSGNPEETRRQFGHPAVPRKNLGAIKDAIDGADALVLGGGGLLQDKTSLLSLKYYTHLIATAKKADKKVALLAQGIGPINSFLGKRAASGALAACDLVSVRDTESLAVARGLGCHRAELTADLAWLARPSQTPAVEFGMAGMKSVAISARPWSNDKKIAEAFGGFCQILFRNNYIPVLVEMDRGMDTKILDAIAKLHGGRCPDIRNVVHPADMLARIGRMNAVVSMRLHAGIFAAISGIAPTMVAYDPKVASFVQIMGLPKALAVEQLTSEALWDMFRSFEEQRAGFSAEFERRREEQLKLSMRNVELLRSTLQA